ncbi:MAG: diaminopimelate epimerase [Phycisphaeraceae bacterium]
MRFVKMHGLGNDYVYINGFAESLPEDDPALAALAQRVSRRRFGIGSDGLILVLPPTSGDAHVRMRMFNADGSEGEMCGNGIRCVCKLTHDHGVIASPRDTPRPLKVETAAGLMSLDYELDADEKVTRVSVDMGEPILDPDRVPVLADELGPTAQPQTFAIAITDRGQHEPSEFLNATFVSMGNPHATIFVQDLEAVDFTRLGPLLETHAAFPNRMNVHFVQMIGGDRARVRHWERGSGATLACGTGACAVAVAASLTGKAGRRLLTHLPGGDLEIEWRDDNRVVMTGPAEEVYRGEM